jgi:hypothetical protein
MGHNPCAVIGNEQRDRAQTSGSQPIGGRHSSPTMLLKQEFSGPTSSADYDLVENVEQTRVHKSAKRWLSLTVPLKDS